MTLMLMKYKSLKKNRMVQKIYLNTLLDAMIMMLLDHCAQSFHKSLAMLENLIVLQQCPLGLATNNC